MHQTPDQTPHTAAPFTLALPVSRGTPVIITSPHSGRNYTPEFLAAARLDATAIRRSEDSFVEELFASAPGLGVPLLAANFPRAWCDVNREAWELDPAMFEDPLPDYVNALSPRVSAGLGTIARIVGTGEPIYHHKMRFADAQARIEQCWVPYHAALQGLIAETMAASGMCLVLDCHSMPSIPLQRGGLRLPDVVLGDVHGTSCAQRMAGFVETRLARIGLRVRRNDPYAGGYITRTYGRPREGVHVLQIEFLRALYMDEARFERNAKFASLSVELTEFVAAVAEVAPALLTPKGMMPLAAE